MAGSPDQNHSLGEVLRHEREKRGITIEQVASATKISVRLLHCLEADQYAELPAKPFIRGFVTSYARFIGLDAKDLLSQFDDFIDAKVQNRPVRDSGHSGYAFEKREGDQSRTVLWFVMGGFVLLGAVVILVLKPSLKHHKQTQADKLRAVHAQPSVTPDGSPVPTASPHLTQAAAPVPLETSQPHAKPAPTPTQTVSSSSVVAKTVSSSSSVPAAAPTEANAPVPVPPLVAVATPTPAAAEPLKETGKPDPLNSGAGLFQKDIRHKIIFKVQEDVWVRYQCDKRPMMKFVIRKDGSLVLRAHDSIRFQTNNAKSVTYNYNGRGVKPLNEAKNIAMQKGTPTLFVSSDSSEKIGDIFTNEKPLPASTPPSSRAASQESPSE